jgi:hypothetical protein
MNSISAGQLISKRFPYSWSPRRLAGGRKADESNLSPGFGMTSRKPIDLESPDLEDR